jgi:alpha-beta hydrolase superfamily lysophospholipase
MVKPKLKQWLYYLKWIMWVLLIQIVLVNITAAIYAYKFTHFYDGPAPVYNPNKNVFAKTWKLFVGPTFYKDTEESLPSFPYQSISFHNQHQKTINGWYSQSDSGSKCVIILHGITANKGYMLAEASQFKSWGYSVLMIDFRGHGKSDGNCSTFGKKETEELDSAFNYAKAKGNQHIIVYGMSMGAIVGMKGIADRSINPDGIILDAPFGSLKSHFKSRAEILGFPSEPFASLVTLWIGIERGYNGFDHGGYKYANKVTCPVLVQWGRKDRYVSYKEVQRIYQSLSSNDKELVVYENADHESLIQVEPTLWNQEVKKFSGRIIR